MVLPWSYRHTIKPVKVTSTAPPTVETPSFHLPGQGRTSSSAAVPASRCHRLRSARRAPWRSAAAPGAAPATPGCVPRSARSRRRAPRRLRCHDMAGGESSQATYPLNMSKSPWYRWPIEIDGLPIKNGDFPWQTVK